MRAAALISIAIWSQGIAGSDARAMGTPLEKLIPVVQCPPLKQYTAAESRRIGEARRKLRAAEPGNILLDVTDDYSVLREQCRAIGDGNPPSNPK
jgi:hypothetical protein